MIQCNGGLGKGNISRGDRVQPSLQRQLELLRLGAAAKCISETETERKRGLGTKLIHLNWWPICKGRSDFTISVG